MAAPSFPPPKCRRWEYTSTKGGLDKNLKLNSVPLPEARPDRHLIQTISVALNPVDYKPAETFGRLVLPKVATPGIDFAGVIVTPASGSPLKPGQLVFGVAGTSPFACGALSEFILAETVGVLPIPEGVTTLDASTVGVAGISAYQSIVPHVKKGDHVFINGGSGGTGVFGIQIANSVGCKVTTSCSSANVDLCKSLGAETVVDYRAGSVVDALVKEGVKFDHVVDNVGGTPEIYWRCHEYMKPGAIYVMVGGTPSARFVSGMLKRKLWPGFLGGLKRKVIGFFPKPVPEDVAQIGQWMAEGKVKTVIDSKFPFEKAAEAFQRLKTGRARGKVVIDIASQTYQKNWPKV